jgi:hypothetical protein
MKRKRNEPTLIDGLTLGHENVGVVALFAPRSALSARSLDRRSVGLLNPAPGATDHAIPWQPAPRRRWQPPTFLPVLNTERLHGHAQPPILEAAGPPATSHEILSHETSSSVALAPTEKDDRTWWQQLQRLVGLSDLGWAFVVVAVGWELFAIAFSRTAGWGWNRGAFFFAWGLGILAFGFFLRTSTQHLIVPRLFLGVNILMVSVLSLVVAMR